jgi:adenylate cyclase
LPSGHVCNERDWFSAGGIRRIRLYSGLILFCFVSTHLLNHALGLISLQAMEGGRWLFLAVWRNPVGSASAAGRHTGHAPGAGVLGHLPAPPSAHAAVAGGAAGPGPVHSIGTGEPRHIHAGRCHGHGYQDSYTMLVLLFWQLRPDAGPVAKRAAAGGLDPWLHRHPLRTAHAPWYRLAMVLYTLAILVPVLALLGFAQAGRYVSVLANDPEWLRQLMADAQVPDALALAALYQTRDAILVALAILLGTDAAGTRPAPVARGRALGTHPLSEPAGGHGAPGDSRCSNPAARQASPMRRFAADVAAAPPAGSVSTRPLGGLPEPSAAEARVLARVGAPANVRLACQLRPQQDIRVTPLIPPSVPSGAGAGRRDR